MLESKTRKKKSLTKFQIIVRLLKDGYLDARVFWNLLGSKNRFKKWEIEEIDKTFRKYYKKS